MRLGCVGTQDKWNKAVAELWLEAILLILCSQTLVLVFNCAKLDGDMLLNWCQKRKC